MLNGQPCRLLLKHGCTPLILMRTVVRNSHYLDWRPAFWRCVIRCWVSQCWQDSKKAVVAITRHW